jgi:hypothetical protein
MKAFAALFSALVLGCLLVVPTAGGTRPERTFLPAEDTVISGVCSFDVGLHIIQNNEYVTVFADSHYIINGVLTVELTNLSDPTKSSVLNISGPGHVTPTPDGGLVLRAVGPWLFFFAADDLYPGSPAMMLFTRGQSTQVVNPDGGGTFQPGRNSIDMCAVLS